jgi:acid phosphatase family membrane protein YuiD
LNGLGYVLVCPLAYLLAGGLKFLVNSVRAGRLAFHQIGLGRFPSTHTAIVSAPAWLIAMKDGFGTPAFAVALGVVFIVVIDALDLRRKLEQINLLLRKELPGSPDAQALRDRVAHRPLEIAGGVAVGCLAAFLAALAG